MDHKTSCVFSLRRDAIPSCLAACIPYPPNAKRQTPNLEQTIVQ
jgi:hypothetical protein